MSIPRLELQAAVIGSRLYSTTKENHELVIDDLYLWTDSRTVLCWLRSENRQFKQFVGFRVGEILEQTDVCSWHWVPTKQNPADEATRDMVPAVLQTDSRWLNGPEFLKHEEIDWPKETKSENFEYEEELEIKRDWILHLDDSTASYLPDIRKFYSWHKLVRSTAWALRFIHNARNTEKRNGPLTIEEFAAAEVKWCQSAQLDAYPNEVSDLMKNKKIDRSSKIYTLNPIIDDNKVLRLEGRIRKSKDIPQWTKQPIILDPHHPYTRLLVQHFHSEAHHNGMEMVANKLRQRYSIPKMRMVIRSIWSHCQFCKNRRSKPQIPKMGDLPPVRVNQNRRAFVSVGMDYFGPMMIKFGKKQEKRYGVLFTCLSYSPGVGFFLVN